MRGANGLLEPLSKNLNELYDQFKISAASHKVTTLLSSNHSANCAIRQSTISLQVEFIALIDFDATWISDHSIRALSENLVA